MVRDIKDLPKAINTAFRVATSGRPGSVFFFFFFLTIKGPVLVDLPKDVTQDILREAVDTSPYSIVDPNIVGANPSSMTQSWLFFFNSRVSQRRYSKSR